jgi:ferredoxin-NADP reductase
VTTLNLLAYILAALLFQGLMGIGMMVWRKRTQADKTLQLIEPEFSEPSAVAWLGWRDFRVTQRYFEDVAEIQCSFYLAPIDGVKLTPFNPGQYLTISLQLGGKGSLEEGNKRSIIRCYSLSECPDPASYRITIKRVPSPADRPELPAGLSSNYFHDQVQVGDVLKVKAPAGLFFIDTDATAPAVFIAGGIGITPMISMLSWCVKNQPQRSTYLYYGVHSSEDHAFKEFLEKLATLHSTFKLQVIYDKPRPDDVEGRDYQHVGYINLELIRNSLPHGRHEFYVCGPPPMLQSIVPALRTWGVKNDNIHFESFGPAAVKPAGPVKNNPLDNTFTSFEVRCSRSNRTLVWDGRDDSLLEFAERHGVPVEAGCRSGNCGTCETKLLSGTIHYDIKPDYEIAKGCCLLCVGKPESALVLDV